MPKLEIDYSNTIIYQIKCKDPTIKDLYIGHTTNFVQRKHAHKNNCTNTKTEQYKCKLYEFIRNNGGWSNWKMEIINFFNCRDHYEARQKEQEYFISLHATLNSVDPMPKPKTKKLVIKTKPTKKTFYCETCDIHYNTLKLFEKHSHSWEMETQNPHLSLKYNCEICHTKTNNKKDFKKHLMTAKHQKGDAGDTGDAVGDVRKEYTCTKCNITYKSRNGLWKHNKKCLDKLIVESEQINNCTENMIIQVNSNSSSNSNDMTQLTNLVIEVVKNNSEFQKQMFDMCKNMQSTIISNSNCNNNTTNNTTFNLQVFLNEYCKDAMNISEFIESFDLQISDLENVGRLGYIEGMSNIIISKINELEVNKRPIHCSDLKREIIYIKEDDVWEREDTNNTKFRRVISKVTRKNIGKLSDWRNMYPDCMDIESDYNEIYLNLIKAAMGPNDTVDNETKIMKKVLKHLVIDKKALTGEAL